MAFEGILLGITLLLVLNSAFGQDANCDFTQNVVPGNTYYVTSPNYPNSYNRGSTCRWRANCPSGYNCRLDCTEINMPQTNQCQGDRLLISRSGDPLLTGADTYCGKGTATAVSTGQSLAVGLIVNRNSNGGRFTCRLTAQIASTASCSCGYKKNNRIVGGQPTGVNEFPMMAGLVDTRTSEIYCGATIIHSHYLVTAAHCLANMNIGNLAVVVGEHNLNVAEPSTQTLRVSDVLIHPNYNANTYANDIAIILTSTNIQFSDRVGPACLPFKFTGNSFAGSRVTVLGWGTQFPGGPDSSVLMKVDLDVISQSSCSSAVSVTNNQMCTYTKGKDSCQDDSGGPLLYTDPSTGLLFDVGIVSNGRFCASGSPGINTRITQYLNWIVSNTPDANYCRK